MMSWPLETWNLLMPVFTKQLAADNISAPKDLPFPGFLSVDLLVLVAALNLQQLLARLSYIFTKMTIHSFNKNVRCLRRSYHLSLACFLELSGTSETYESSREGSFS